MDLQTKTLSWIDEQSNMNDIRITFLFTIRKKRESKLGMFFQNKIRIVDRESLLYINTISLHGSLKLKNCPQLFFFLRSGH